MHRKMISKTKFQKDKYLYERYKNGGPLPVHKERTALREWITSITTILDPEELRDILLFIYGTLHQNDEVIEVLALENIIKVETTERMGRVHDSPR